MPEWFVEIQGDQLDLDAITQLLRSSRLNVTREHDVYYLRCTDFTQLASADEIRERAREILQRAGAAEHVRCGSCLPLEIGEVFRVEPDGTRRPFFSSPLLVTFNVRVSHAPVAAEDALAFGQWVQLAERDAKVDKALRILITRGTNWINLYNILDVVLSDVGSMIWQADWAPESEVKRFKHTADSESTLGDEARHGRERTEPPADPMPLKEADSLVRKILRDWLAWKSTPRT